MKTLLLIDGNAIMHRAFHALPPMNSPDGTPTNTIYGFLTMVHKATTDFAPDYVVVCFDTPKDTFRKELLKEYQAHRPSLPDDFKIQIPLIQQLLDEGGIPRMEKPGYEADDVIGTLAVRFKKHNLRVLILTGDKDIMQLVDDNVFVITPKVGLSSISIYDRAAVIEKLGIEPEQIPDYKALAGDSSDNYKGVPGIGPKTASGLIRQFKSVEHMMEHTAEIEKERVRESIIANHDVIVLMKQIATIVTDVPVDLTLEGAAYNGFQETMEDTMHHLGLNNLCMRLLKIKPVRPVVEEEPTKALDHEQQELF